MYWDIEDVVHSTVEGRAVRMVLAGPLLGVVLEEGEECRQGITDWNHYGNLIWTDWDEREVEDIGQVVEKHVYTGGFELGYILCWDIPSLCGPGN